MYVRGARNRDEVWLLDRIEGMGLDETAFRSRDYVIAIDEVEGERAGFGRLRVHKAADDTEYCELTSIGVVKSWRGQGVGAHVVERLVELAGDKGFETIYAFVSSSTYLEQFGFEPVDPTDLPEKLLERLDTKRQLTDPEAVPLQLAVDYFVMPTRLRERFKGASREEATPDEEEDIDVAEEFGIDPETATYKYDTDGRIRR